MDTILDMTVSFLSSVYFCLLQTDVAWEIIFCLSMSVNCIGILFGKMALVTVIMGAISL